MKATVPVGVLAVPAFVALTKAVQDVACPTAIDDGVHVTTVDVLRLVTVTLLLVPVLPLWATSVAATV